MVTRKAIGVGLGLVCVLGAVMIVACGAQNQTREDFSTEIVSETYENATDFFVYYNRESGFYDEFYLEMYCPIENATIYYTTDGTFPTRDSFEYEKPILLTDITDMPEVLAARTDYCPDNEYVPAKRIVKGHIFRAIACLEDGTESTVSNGTFFIGINRAERYGDVPVISLITDPANMVDYEKGILVLGKTYQDWLDENPNNINEAGWKSPGNYTNKGKEWERPVSFEYMSADGSNIMADMGIRIKGAATRSYIQKSFQLYAREEYGVKNIKAELIPNNVTSSTGEPIIKYKNFILRNGGNDNYYAKLRDPLIQSLVYDRHFDTQQSTPSVVFLNGEYWGLYDITEEYTDNYIEINYGIEKENVIIVKKGEIEEGVDSDILLYEELYLYITTNDMRNEDNYRRATEMMDLQGLLDYAALCIYVDNRDSMFVDNNWSIWRTREADNMTQWSDGRWRFLIYDNEYSAGCGDIGKIFDVDTISEKLAGMTDSNRQKNTEYPLVDIFAALYQNDDFRNELIITLCDLRNYNFSLENFDRVFDEMSATYSNLAIDSIWRYGPDWVIEWYTPEYIYNLKLDEVKEFFYGRYEVFPILMEGAFGLEKSVTVTINVSDSERGKVKLNQSELDFSKLLNETFTGEYFTEIPITLEAISGEGFKFECWNIIGATVLDAQGSKITILPEEGCYVEAVFD